MKRSRFLMQTMTGAALIGVGSWGVGCEPADDPPPATNDVTPMEDPGSQEEPLDPGNDGLNN